MNYTSRLFALAVLSSSLVVGCNPRTDETSDSATDSDRQQMGRTDASGTTGTRTTQDSGQRDAYTFAQKDRFIASMEEELSNINRSIEQLALRIDRSSAEVRAATTPRLNELRNQAQLLETQMDEVRAATATTWEETKATTRETFENLQANFDDARQWLSDRMAP